MLARITRLLAVVSALALTLGIVSPASASTNGVPYMAWGGPIEITTVWSQPQRIDHWLDYFGDGTKSYSVVSDGGTGCAINPATGYLTWTAGQTGACRISASATGTATWDARSEETDVHIQPLPVPTVMWFGQPSWGQPGTLTIGQSPWTPWNAPQVWYNNQPIVSPPAITYSVVSQGGSDCTINSATGAVTYSTTGTCRIKAESAADMSWAAASAEVDLVISKPLPFLTIYTPDTPSAGGYATVYVQTDSDAVPTVSVTNDTGSICSLGNRQGSSGTYLYYVTFSGAGQCDVEASVPATSSYAATTATPLTLAVAHAQPPFQWYDDTFYTDQSPRALTPPYSQWSNGAITYAVVSQGGTGCTVNSTTGMLTYNATGTCRVEATMAQTSVYASVTAQVDIFVVAPQTQQVIWNPGQSTLIFGSSPWTPGGGQTATTSPSSGTITYAIQSDGGTGCTVNPTTGALTYGSTAGTCTVSASTPSRDYMGSHYGPASTTYAFSIAALQLNQRYLSWPDESIDMAQQQPYESIPPSYQGIGSPVFTVDSAGTTGCTVNASTGDLTYTGVGTCKIKASLAQAGSYAAADVVKTFTITRLTPSLTWTGFVPSLTVASSPWTPTSQQLAQTNSDGAITYSVLSDGGTGCTVNASTGVLTFTATGSCQVQAQTPQTSAYEAATTSRTFTVNRTFPTLQWVSPPFVTLTTADSPWTPTTAATTNSDGTLTYALLSAGTTGCTVNPTTGVVTFTGTGTGAQGCKVMAEVAQTATYASSSTVLTITVNAAPSSGGSGGSNGGGGSSSGGSSSGGSSSGGSSSGGSTSGGTSNANAGTTSPNASTTTTTSGANASTTGTGTSTAGSTTGTPAGTAVTWTARPADVTGAATRPGSAAVLVGTQSQPATIAPDVLAGQVRVSAGGVTVSVGTHAVGAGNAGTGGTSTGSSTNTTRAASGLGPDGEVVVGPGTAVALSASGFAPGTVLTAYLVRPDGTAAVLGTATASADGTVATSATVDDAVPAGRYVVQLAGTGADSRPRAVSLPVWRLRSSALADELAQAGSAAGSAAGALAARVRFRVGTSGLTTARLARIARLAALVPDGATAKATVLRYLPASGTTARALVDPAGSPAGAGSARTLASKRAKAIAKALRAAGIDATVRTVTVPRPRRAVDVVVRVTPTA